MTERKSIGSRLRRRFSRFLRILGPGIVTGAADDDPSGIATYSQTGAQFGYGQLWTVVLVYPLMTAIQEACARIGAVTGKGITAVVKEHYSKKVLFPLVFLVIIANTINIGADIGAMTAAAELLFPIPVVIMAIFFTVFILLLEIFTSYKSYMKVLKYLTLALLVYPVTAILVGQNWGEVFKALVVPSIELNFGFFFILTGVLGTTISPYMFFWQASGEVEEEVSHNVLNQHKERPRITKRFMKNLRIDNALGMLFSQIIMFSIIITTASVLNKNGITDIKTAADAAIALEPLVSTFPNSGFIAKTIFAAGIIGIGLMAIPVLAGSAAYALCEVFNWREGLSLKFKKAHGFYGIIIAAMVIGLLINMLGFNPIKALVFTAVFNGIAAVPLIYIIARVSRNEKIMGEYKSGNLSSSLIWLTFAIMFLSAFLMFATILFR